MHRMNCYFEFLSSPSVFLLNLLFFYRNRLCIKGRHAREEQNWEKHANSFATLFWCAHSSCLPFLYKLFVLFTFTTFFFFFTFWRKKKNILYLQKAGDTKDGIIIIPFEGSVRPSVSVECILFFSSSFRLLYFAFMYVFSF